MQAANVTESQLDNLLAERRLNREQRELAEEGDRSQTSAVHASEEKDGAVGTLLHVDLNIEGLPVKAMVDTGAPVHCCFKINSPNSNGHHSEVLDNF